MSRRLAHRDATRSFAIKLTINQNLIHIFHIDIILKTLSNIFIKHCLTAETLFRAQKEKKQNQSRKHFKNYNSLKGAIENYIYIYILIENYIYMSKSLLHLQHSLLLHRKYVHVRQYLGETD